MTPPAPDLAPPEQVLEFGLGEERYCVGIERVEEIVRAEELTSLPDSPAEVAGMMNLRGQTTTILDPARVFELDVTQSGRQVVIFDGEQRIGWLVDRVHRVRSLRDVDVDAGPDSPFVSGLIHADGEFVIWVESESVNESVST